MLLMEVYPYIYFWWHEQVSCQRDSQKLLQGLVRLELTAYLSVFNPFLTQ